VRDVREVLHESDAFVLPTLNIGRGEAFGVALIEAMSCGLACVATNTDGPREIIEPGRSGLLVDPGDVGALRRALDAVCTSSDLRQNLGRAARERVVEKFSLDDEAQKTAAVYERLAFRAARR
jgi:mannosyltransferase